MKGVYEYYTDNVNTYTKRLDYLRKRIYWMGTARLIVVALAFLSLWIARYENGGLLALITLAFILLFVVLMWLHNKLDGQRQDMEIMIQLNKDELKALDYDFSAFDGAAEKSSGEHPFSLDLDIFGNHSLFQSINRTVTFIGREKLADWFLHPLTDKREILRRQEAVKELAHLSALRQEFYVMGQIALSDKSKNISNLFKAKTVFSSSILWEFLVWAIPFGWIALGVAYGLGWISGAALSLYLVVSIFIAYGKAGAVSHLHASVNKMESLFSSYYKLLERIENENFQSEELREIQGQLGKGTAERASIVLKRLARYISGLDQRFSLAGIICNILYLRDTRHAILLEHWEQDYVEMFPIWLDALSRFDALSSLGGFAFNHPNAVYPTISETYFQMEGKGLAHPLLNRNICVRNDISICKAPLFHIITGANMAGKSTYLRTVGVNYLLACIGVPVCAESLIISPANLVTSLRTSDSLAGNESYFFAELKRLKMIIDRLKDGERLFIILDEILKGTNSIDKQKGSLALIRQLITYESCGIIATHDLVLGNLADEFSAQIKNFCFEADIKDEGLSFSYKLREGIAQNMNACFLMRKMGITI